MAELHEGQRIVVSTGEYSDYQILGLAEVLKRFSVEEVKERYLAGRPSQREEYSFDEGSFFTWLVSEGYLREFSVDWAHLDLGSYRNGKVQLSRRWR